MMDSLTWLHILLYDIGKQKMETHQVQYSYKKGEDTIYCKRKYSLDLTEQDKFNHRQILLNEVLIDIDNPNENTETFLKETHIILEQAKVNHTIFKTNSKGYHISIFDDTMFGMNETQRIQHRIKRIELFVKEYDKMLLNGTHLISMEFAFHWKSGKPKELLYYYFEDKDIMNKIIWNVRLEL